MSLATVLTIMGRIESATSDSPIAVFRSDAPGKLDAHFASTIKAKSLRGACALAKNQGFTHIAWAVRRDGIWEVAPCVISQ